LHPAGPCTCANSKCVVHGSNAVQHRLSQVPHDKVQGSTRPGAGHRTHAAWQASQVLLLRAGSWKGALCTAHGVTGNGQRLQPNITRPLVTLGAFVPFAYHDLGTDASTSTTPGACSMPEADPERCMRPAPLLNRPQQGSLLGRKRQSAASLKPSKLARLRNEKPLLPVQPRAAASSWPTHLHRKQPNICPGKLVQALSMLQRQGRIRRVCVERQADGSKCSGPGCRHVAAWSRCCHGIASAVGVAGRHVLRAPPVRSV
jgi:hypothetical protein